MRKEDCFYLGRIVKKYSFKGELILKLDTDEPEIYENIDTVFIDFGKSLVPYFIEKRLFQKGNHMRVRFEEVNSEEEAETLLKRDVYLPLDLLPTLEENQFYFHEVEGFAIEDVNYGPIGTVESVNDATAQPLFVVSTTKGKILIPMVDDFIRKIDRTTRKITVATPEGLIDMNNP